MEIIDQFLDSSEFDLLHDFIMGEEMLWYFNSYVDYDISDYRFVDDPDNYQFVHNFFNEGKRTTSRLLPKLAPVIEKINCKKLLRVKSNLNTRTSKHIKRDFHVDSDKDWKNKNHKTSILYINTNNGWTEFEDGSKVNCVSNRMVIFDGSMRHAGVTCTVEKRKVLINFNYER